MLSCSFLDYVDILVLLGSLSRTQLCAFAYCLRMRVLQSAGLCQFAIDGTSERPLIRYC